MPFIPQTPEEKETNKAQETCRHPEHYPPTMIVLDPGTHKYQCPSCGKVSEIFIPGVTF